MHVSTLWSKPISQTFTQFRLEYRNFWLKSRLAEYMKKSWKFSYHTQFRGFRYQVETKKMVFAHTHLKTNNKKHPKSHPKLNWTIHFSNMFYYFEVFKNLFGIFQYSKIRVTTKNRASKFLKNQSYLFRWLGGVLVRPLDLRLEIAGSITAAALSNATLGKLFAHTCLCHKTV